MIVLLALLIFISLVILTLNKMHSTFIRSLEYAILFILFSIFFIKHHLQDNAWNISDLPVMVSFLVVFGFIYYFNKRVDKHNLMINSLKVDYQNNLGAYNNVVEQEVKNRKEFEYLNEKLEQTSMLYKSTLSMSSTLDFKEILNYYVNSLGEMDGFLKLFIVIKFFNEHEDNEDNLFAYKYNKTKKELLHYPARKVEDLFIKRLEKERKILTIDDPLSVGLYPESFKISKKNKALIIPLYFQQENLGGVVFFTEGYSNIEQLELLSLHFSMELHKSRLYEKIRRLSSIDSLTSVYLKEHFFSLFDDELSRHRAQNNEMALIMMDIDYFKEVNDKFGHLTGDIVIQEVANKIKKFSREEDLIGRFGGDEFLIMLPKSSREKARQISVRIKDAISNIIFNKGSKNEFKITVSIGVAMYPKCGKNREALLSFVDIALYKAKEKGRNRIEFSRF